ncbi:hypothetical protein SDC9_158830 [bioreactor metagenome]|uniref:Uncharacterized protein n=1 Tax=bioreactor metagenome TaxID=1076179 RepID=A0A645FB88_9ZZZZ
MICYGLLISRIDFTAQYRLLVRLPNVRRQTTEIDFSATQGIMRIVFTIGFRQLSGAFAVQNAGLMPQTLCNSHEFETVAAGFADDDAVDGDLLLKKLFPVGTRYFGEPMFCNRKTSPLVPEILIFGPMPYDSPVKTSRTLPDHPVSIVNSPPDGSMIAVYSLAA